MKPSKLIRYLEAKHPYHPTKSYRILPTPWSEFETTDYLAGRFPNKTGIIWNRTWNCQAKNSHDWKNACETLFVEYSKTTSWRSSEANMKGISLPVTLFRGTFQNFGRCERPGDKWNKSISYWNAFFTWISQQILLHVLSCLFSWGIFIQETLKKSSCFVKNCELQQVQMFARSKKFFDSARLQ